MIEWEKIREERVQIDLSKEDTLLIFDGETIINLDMVYFVLEDTVMIFEANTVLHLDEIDLMMSTLLHTTVYQAAHIQQNPSRVLLDLHEVVMHGKVVDYAYSLQIICQEKTNNTGLNFILDIVVDQVSSTNKQLISFGFCDPPIIVFKEKQISLDVEKLKTHLRSGTDAYSGPKPDWMEDQLKKGEAFQ